MVNAAPFEFCQNGVHNLAIADNPMLEPQLQIIGKVRTIKPL